MQLIPITNLFQVSLIIISQFITIHCRPSSDEDLLRDHRAPPSTCKVQPHHHVAFGQWATRTNDTHKLSLMTPSLHQHTFRTINEDELRRDELLAGSKECPVSPNLTPDEPLMGRSLCPWYWKVNYNPTRIPAMLPEAVCRCPQAVTGVENIVIYECQPMTMHVRVLQLDNDCKEYQERTIEMAVACVSVVQSSLKLNKGVGVEHSAAQVNLLREN